MNLDLAGSTSTSRRAGGVAFPQLPSRSTTEPFELLLFHTDPVVVSEATAAGMAGFIVDWEHRGKERRQAGEGTQINHDTLNDLVAVRATTSALVICRINSVGWWTRREVDAAVDAGVDEILLPMVRDARAVDRVLDLIAGRCDLGILIETQSGVRAAAELARRPLSRIYVGLNDLRIDRGSTNLFEPLVDGTVDRVRAVVDGPRFGVAGLTLPDRGVPVPSRLLAARLVALRADFTFLRRSFLADTAGRPLAPAVRIIADHLDTIRRRPAGSDDVDREALERLVRVPGACPA